MEHSTLTLGGLVDNLRDALTTAEAEYGGDIAVALGGLMGRVGAFTGMLDHIVTYCGLGEVRQYELREFIRTMAGECSFCRAPLAEWNDRLTDDDSNAWCPACATTDMHDSPGRWVDYHKSIA